MEKLEKFESVLYLDKICLLFSLSLPLFHINIYSLFSSSFFSSFIASCPIGMIVKRFPLEHPFFHNHHESQIILFQLPASIPDSYRALTRSISEPNRNVLIAYNSVTYRAYPTIELSYIIIGAPGVIAYLFYYVNVIILLYRK